MNRHQTERLTKRLAAIEARRPAEPWTIVHIIVDPDLGPTGEEWTRTAAGCVKTRGAGHAPV